MVIKDNVLKFLIKKKSQTGSIGDIILVSIKKAKSKKKIKKVKKKELHRAIIVHTKKKINRYDGSSIKFHKNSIVLLKADIKKNKYQVLGTRILGLVSNELRLNDDNLKIISLASRTI